MTDTTDPRALKAKAEKSYAESEIKHLSNVVDRLNAENDRLREALEDIDMIEQAISDSYFDGATMWESAEYVSKCIIAALKGSDQ